MPVDKRGPRGAIGRLREKAERFAPGAGKKHKEAAETAYSDSVTAGNTRGVDPAVLPAPSDGGAD